MLIIRVGTEHILTNDDAWKDAALFVGHQLLALSTMPSLGEELPKEQQRVRELVKLYTGLPGNAGVPAAMLMEQVLTETEQAVMNGDVVKMLKCYEQLQGFQA
jgi:hypothetical protein